MDKYCFSSASLPHLTLDSSRNVLNVSSRKDGSFDTLYRMQIIFKLKTTENKIEPTRESELFTGQGLKGASLQHKY